MRLLVIILLFPVFSYSQIVRTNPFYVSSTIAVDVDAQRFIDSAGLTDATQKAAIITLVQQLKDSSLWTSLFAIYPLIGGTAATCKWNLKNTAQFNLTFTASPTFSTDGVDWNGTTQFASTGLTPSTTLSLNSTHLSYYSRENNSTASVLEMGSNDGVVARTYFGIKQAIAINQNSGADAFSNSNTSGFFIVTRTTSVLTTEYMNGTSVATVSTTSTALSSVEIYIGCRNNNGTAATFTDRQCAFASIGTGLTAAQSLTFYNIVQAFQTTLSRQV